MKITNISIPIYLLSLLFIISPVKNTIAQLTLDEIKKLSKEEIANLPEDVKIATLEHFEKDTNRIRLEIDELLRKMNKTLEYYVETYKKTIKENEKSYAKEMVRFVKKDDIMKKYDEMLDNFEVAKANAMKKEYEDRTKFYYNIWTKSYFDLEEQWLYYTEYIADIKSSLKENELVDLSGTWYCYYAKVGSKGSECSIMHSGNEISFTNEFGNTSNGEFINTNQVKAIDWENGLIGNITENGKRISWKNGSYWVREKE